jgi:metal-responsive CopG/Arc/MetJ family transcriptional regulator
MRRMEIAGERNTRQRGLPVRASISFPRDLYEMLEQIAKKKKVSLAWVVRDAVERYAAEQSALTER